MVSISQYQTRDQLLISSILAVHLPVDARELIASIFLSVTPVPVICSFVLLQKIAEYPVPVETISIGCPAI
jgi:hypothetical protein